MKAALIDHDDSFTQNLRQWLKPLFSQIDVYNHHDYFSQQSRLNSTYSLFVLSPGPKNPSDYPQTLEWLKTISPTTPVLGVCLGMQMMVLSESGAGAIKKYSPPLHGKKSKLHLSLGSENKSDENLLSLQGLSVARYHSLVCEPKNISPAFDVIANSADDQQVMWIQHQTKKWMGLQFHPESFLTEKPELHLNYLKKWLQK